MQQQQQEEQEQGGTTPPWAELLGSDRWSGLLDPLHPSLLRLILRCGDLCQVTYDAFVSDEHSKYCGASRYGKSNLLTKCMLPFAGDYAVSDFIYAASDLDLPIAFLFSLSREAWSKESNWIGYVAVSSDSYALATGRRHIVVAWRGTIRDLEWADVLKPKLVSIDSLLSHSSDDIDDDQAPKVMEGWHTIYTSTDDRSPFSKASARDQLMASIKRLTQAHVNEELSIICVGHSLGASLAVLSAFDIVENGLSKTGDKAHFPVAAVVFGSPQVGNRAFNERLERLPSLGVLHVRNRIDLIPLYPTGLLGYVDSGVKLVVDGRKSPFLKDSKSPGDWHNLQGMLHAVAGWNGEGGEFELRVRRSVGLVNKSCQYLKDELLVPGSWWVEQNKGMVMAGDDGDWVMAPLDDDDLPVPPLTSSYSGEELNKDAVDSDHEVGKKAAARGNGGLFKCVACFNFKGGLVD